MGSLLKNYDVSTSLGEYRKSLGGPRSLGESEYLDNKGQEATFLATTESETLFF